MRYERLISTLMWFTKRLSERMPCNTEENLHRKNLCSSVIIVTSYVLYDQGSTLGRDRGRKVSLCHHPASYSIFKQGISVGLKRPERESRNLPPP
jgi:hypothetical protein